MRKALVAAMVAGCVAVAAATPAAAFEKWVCTAKDSRGAKFSALVDGLFDVFVKGAASRDALAKCKAESKAPNSCKVAEADCVRPPD